MRPLGWLGRKTSTQTVQYCLSTSLIDTTGYTTAPESLLIHFSTLPAPVPVYWYVAAQLITAPDKVLLIPYSQQVPQYQSYWHDTPYLTVHFCSRTIPAVYNSPSTRSIDTTQSTSVPSTSSTDTLWSTAVPVPGLLIGHSLFLSQYQSFWYDVHYCPCTSPSYMMSNTALG